MATAEFTDCVQQVGEVAGIVWHCLRDQGPMSNAKLAKEVDAPRDLVMQAVGWLAREGKIVIVEGSRGRKIELVA